MYLHTVWKTPPDQYAGAYLGAVFVPENKSPQEPVHSQHMRSTPYRNHLGHCFEVILSNVHLPRKMLYTCEYL